MFQTNVLMKLNKTYCLITFQNIFLNTIFFKFFLITFQNIYINEIS